MDTCIRFLWPPDKVPHFPTVQEATSVRSKPQQGWVLLQVLRENPLPASLQASSGCRQSLVFLLLCLHHSNLGLHLPMATFSMLCFCVSSSFIRTPIPGFRAHPNPVRPHLYPLHLQISSKKGHILRLQVNITLKGHYSTHYSTLILSYTKKKSYFVLNPACVLPTQFLEQVPRVYK